MSKFNNKIPALLTLRSAQIAGIHKKTWNKVCFRFFSY